MRTTDDLPPRLNRHALDALAADLAALNLTWDEPTLRSWLARRADGQHRLAIVGNIKSGKSTLLNAVLGAELLPSRREACTLHPVFVQLAPFDGTIAGTLADADAPVALFRDLPDPRPALMAEAAAARRGERAHLRHYHVAWPAEVRHRMPRPADLALIDTPGANEMEGLGVTREGLRRLIQDALQQVDGVVFVLNCANLQDDANRELFAWIAQLRPDLVPHGLTFVLNQIDVKTPGDPPLAADLETVRRLATAWGVPTPRVYPLSSQHALLGRLLLQGEAPPALLQAAQSLPWPVAPDAQGRPRQVLAPDAAMGARLLAQSGLLAFEDEVLTPWLRGDARVVQAADERLCTTIGATVGARLATAGEQVAEARRQAETDLRLGHLRGRRLLAALDELRLAQDALDGLCTTTYLAHQAGVHAMIAYHVDPPTSLPARLHCTGPLEDAVRPYLAGDYETARQAAASEVAAYRSRCEQDLTRLALGRRSPVEVSIWDYACETADTFDPFESRKTPEAREFERVVGDHETDALRDALSDRLVRAVESGDVADDLDDMLASANLLAPQGLARFNQILEEAHAAVHACLVEGPETSLIAPPRTIVGPGAPTLSLAWQAVEDSVYHHLPPHAVARYLCLLEDDAHAYDAAGAYAAMAEDLGQAISAGCERVQADLVRQLGAFLAVAHTEASRALDVMRAPLTQAQARLALDRQAHEAALRATQATETRLAQATSRHAALFPASLLTSPGR